MHTQHESKVASTSSLSHHDPSPTTN